MDELVNRLREQCYGVVLPGVEVGAQDNFFDLGGDSIQLIRVVAIAQDTFGVEIDALDFFLKPTLARLAETVDGSRRAQAASR